MAPESTSNVFSSTFRRTSGCKALSHAQFAQHVVGGESDVAFFLDSCSFLLFLKDLRPMPLPDAPPGIQGVTYCAARHTGCYILRRSAYRVFIYMGRPAYRVSDFDFLSNITNF